MMTATMSAPSDGLWTVRQASQWLSVTELSLRTMMKRREIPGELLLKIGRRVRFRSDLFKSWVLQQRSA